MISLIFLTLALMTPRFAHADPMIEVAPLSFGAGAGGSWGQCPCYRWQATVRMISGEIETRDFLITTDAIVRLDTKQTLDFSRITQQLFTFGAMELLWKGGHIGLAFDGLQLGGDLDRFYSDILRIGGQAMVTIVRNEHLRLDLRAGYRIENFELNLGETKSREMLPVSLWLSGTKGPWSAKVGFTAAPNATDPLSEDRLLLRADAKVNLAVKREGTIRTNIGLSAYAEHDRFRGELALESNNVAALLTLDISLVPPMFRTKQERE